MSNERDPDRDQMLPVPNDTESIHDLVAADLAERKSFGTRKYGTPLQAHNGRDALLDAYEEALDLCVYLKQALVERDGPGPVEPNPVEPKPVEPGANRCGTCGHHFKSHGDSAGCLVRVGVDDFCSCTFIESDFS